MLVLAHEALSHIARTPKKNTKRKKSLNTQESPTKRSQAAK